MSLIADRILEIRQRIDRACLSADRDPASVTLVGVSKTVGRAEIDAAYEAGLRDFGENRVQDAIAKFTDDWPADATRHHIGSLQTNKVRQAMRVIDLFHAVDRLSLVEEMRKQAEKLDRVVPVLVQVNVARDPQKSGCAPEEVSALAASIAGAPELELRGLMTIAPLVSDPEETRPVFAVLRTMRDDLEQTLGISLPHLSMGMTNDFEVAVQEGATLVRVGRAIFVPDQV
ncbi:MAG: YggS family pyridoxal phosphate-dependent enzyme [Thermomicrobiales bacterium]|nr:YggS family pyridoxal phosphate-dependent enzyme [Thermomicrobiales bacterium]